MNQITFTLDDADGVEHLYEVELYSVAEGAALQLMLSQPLIRLVGALGEALMQALAPGKLGFLQRVQLVKWDRVLDTLPALPEMIEKRGGPDLFNRVFARTKRVITVPDADGNKVEIRQDLKDSAMRDQAFADGNYLELWSASVAVLLVNFTRHGRGGSLSWKRLLSSATGIQSTPSIQDFVTMVQSDVMSSGNRSPAS